MLNRRKKMDQNQQNQSKFDKFKNLSFGAYLCICAAIKGIVEIVKLITKCISNKRK